MKVSPRPLVIAMALASFGSAAQPLDLGPDVSPMLRFQLHPRMEKAFDAMSRGDNARAVNELRQAQRLAPGNTVVALYLADAHRRSGQSAEAAAVLKEQLTRQPGEPRLTEALRRLESAPTESGPSLQPMAVETARRQAAPPTPPAPSVPASAAPSAPPTQGMPPRRDRTTYIPSDWIKTVAAEPAPPALVAQGPATSPPRAAGGSAPPALQMSSPEPVQAENPGYESASQAYAAVARGDFAGALPLARDAVQASPEHMDYQRLFVYLLIENGHYKEANTHAAQLDSHPQAEQLKSDAQWQALRRQARQGVAFGHFEAARQAGERGETAEALRQAQTGAEQAPDVPAHRLQWAGLLLRSGDAAKAQNVAQEGLDLGEAPALRVLLGAALQAQSQDQASAQAFDAALAVPDLTSHEYLNYRVIAADAALAARQPERALSLLEPLIRSGEPSIAGRQAEIQTALRRVVSPASLHTPQLRLPVVNCYGSGGAAGCEIWPGQDAPDPAREVAQQAYDAYTARDYASAASKAQEAARLNTAHLPYQLLRLQALAAGGEKEQALQEAEQVLQQRTDVGEVLALRSRIRYELGQHEAASADARAALEAGGLSLASEVDLLLQLGRHDEAATQFAKAMEGPGLRDSADPDLAYLAGRVGDDRTALTVFNRAREQGRLPATSLRDGAYTASRLAENDQAVDYFQSAIDQVESGGMKLSAQELFATRREVADRTRSWGASALLGYRGFAPGSVSAAQPGLYGDIAQLVGEVYWRPQKFGDGRFWELYGGVAQTVYSRHGGRTGSDTTQGTIGIRAKPFSHQNLILSAERRIRIGSLSINDWLLRAGYSGGMGTDMRVDVPNWTTINIYAEAGRFLRLKQNYATFEAQAGRSFRMGEADGRLVLYPHAVLGVDYNSARTSAGYNGAAGAGIGIGVRYWFREDRYNAPRSYIDLSLQYRARLMGDERGKGTFLRASLVF